MPEFYTSIAPYYRDIFPLQDAQISFCSDLFSGNLSGLSIVDVGCATGDLAFALARNGAKVSAFDPDERMIAVAREQKEGLDTDFFVDDIGSFASDGMQVDLVTCFGNTVAHLREHELQKAFFKFFGMLSAGGKLVVQMLNYDCILGKKITVLPRIENDSVVFERYYEFAENLAELIFISRLFIKSENRTVDNSILLYPHRKHRIVSMLEKAGFVNIEIFGSFKKDIPSGTQLPLVFVAEKQ